MAWRPRDRSADRGLSHLANFGRATVKGGSAIMAGVAGVALGLFVYLQNDSQRHFVEGIITSVDYTKYQGVRMANKNPILGFLTVTGDRKSSFYRFVILRDEVS